MARPSDYTPEMAAHICSEMVEGRSLRAICLDDNMPSKTSVFRWLALHQEFRDQYAYAREAQADTLADEITYIADTPQIGFKTTTKANGDIETVEGDMVERSRLQIDARKWVASKLKPKKYGDATLMKLADSEGANLQVSVIRFSDCPE